MVLLKESKNNIKENVYIVKKHSGKGNTENKINERKEKGLMILKFKQDKKTKVWIIKTKTTDNKTKLGEHTIVGRGICSHL